MLDFGLAKHALKPHVVLDQQTVDSAVTSGEGHLTSPGSTVGTIVMQTRNVYWHVG